MSRAGFSSTWFGRGKPPGRTCSCPPPAQWQWHGPMRIRNFFAKTRPLYLTPDMVACWLALAPLRASLFDRKTTAEKSLSHGIFVSKKKKKKKKKCSIERPSLLVNVCCLEDLSLPCRPSLEWRRAIRTFLFVSTSVALIPS